MFRRSKYLRFPIFVSVTIFAGLVSFALVPRTDINGDNLRAPVPSTGPNDLFWNTNGVASSWTSNWGNDASGPYTSVWTANKDANFTASSLVTFVTNTQIGNITVSSGSTVAVTPAGTLSTSGSVRTLDVGSNSTLDLGSQNISTAAGTGFIKNGAGTLFTSNGQAYPGGFTLNDGIVIAGGVNAMGAGPLTINGGTIAANASRTFATGKFSPLTINGDFVIGAVTGGVPTGNGSASANITFADAANLGTATRKITIGSNAVYTLNGVLSSATPGSGLTVNATAGSVGTLVLGGANTFTGPVTISGGTLSVSTINNGGAASNLGKASNAAGNLIFDGGTLRYTGASSAVTNRNFTISGGKTAVIDVAQNDITFSGAAAATSGSLNKSGAGFLSLSGPNLYSGDTVISGGGLALVGSGSIANSPVVEVRGDTIFDVSSLINPYVMPQGQTLRATGTTATGTLATVSGKGLSTAANSRLEFTIADSAHVPLTIQGSGTMTIGSGNSVWVNTIIPLGAGDYTLIAKGTSGTVTGQIPLTLMLTGSRLASGMMASLLLLDGQLVMRVSPEPLSSVSISGRVSAANGRGITNAVLTLTGGPPPVPVSVTTNRSGIYQFGNLLPGQAYTISVNAARFVFTPPMRTLTPSSNIANADFIAQ